MSDKHVIHSQYIHVFFSLLDQFDGDFSLQQACECPQMCKLVTFDKQLSFARLPSEKYQRYFESVKINDIQ